MEKAFGSIDEKVVYLKLREADDNLILGDMSSDALLNEKEQFRDISRHLMNAGRLKRMDLLIDVPNDPIWKPAKWILRCYKRLVRKSLVWALTPIAEKQTRFNAEILAANTEMCVLLRQLSDRLSEPERKAEDTGSEEKK